MTIRELCEKEVVQLEQGVCLGRADDLAFDPATAQLQNLILLGRPRLFGLLGTGGIDKALDIFHPRNIRTYIKTLGNDPETRQILSAEFQNLMEAAKRTRMQPGDAKTLPEGK